LPEPIDFLLGVALPAALCALLLLCVRRASWGPTLGAAVAAAAGYVAAHVLQRGWRGFPPTEATDWAWVAAAAGGLIGLFHEGLAEQRTRRVLRIAAVVVLAGLVLRVWREGDGLRAARFAAFGAAIAAAAVWGVAERREPAPGWFVPLALALTAAAAATAIGLSGSAKLAMLAGGVCGVLSAAATACALRLAPPTVEGVAGPAVLALLSLVLSAQAYSSLPASSAWLIAAAPIVALGPRMLLKSDGFGNLARGSLLLAVGLLGLAVKLAKDAGGSFEGL
jgi:hypothetical protein